MNALFDAYDLCLDELLRLYRRLNEPITYADGMVTSLGILYWGREEHYTQLGEAVVNFKAEGCYRLSDVLYLIRTPGRMANV